MHELHMCGINGEGLEGGGFDRLGMVLGRRWRAGGRIGEERWGVERGLRCIRASETVRMYEVY